MIAQAERDAQLKSCLPPIAQMGGAIATLPADLEILDVCLQAEGTAQIRGIALLR